MAGATALLSRTRLGPEIAQAARPLFLISALLLIVATVLGWNRGGAVPSMASRLFLIAAAVLVPSGRRASQPPIHDALRAGAALILSGSGLAAAWAIHRAPDVSGTDPTQMFLALIGAVAIPILAGLGLRHAVEASGRAFVRSEMASGLPLGLYGGLALAFCAVSLGSLWSLGALPWGSRSYAGLAAAFLAWSAVWLADRNIRLWYACLANCAALLLLWLPLTSGFQS
jgi:hypothetical protein